MIAAIKAQTDALEKLPQAIAMAVAEAMKSVQPPIVEVVTKAPEMPISPVGNDLGKHFPTSQAVATPSKMELAIQWLKANPEDMKLTGRDLEALRMPQGVKISYRTWNDAKKDVGV